MGRFSLEEQWKGSCWPKRKWLNDVLCPPMVEGWTPNADCIIIRCWGEHLTQKKIINTEEKQDIRYTKVHQIPGGRQGSRRHSWLSCCDHWAQRWPHPSSHGRCTPAITPLNSCRQIKNQRSKIKCQKRPCCLPNQKQRRPGQDRQSNCGSCKSPA